MPFSSPILEEKKIPLHNQGVVIGTSQSLIYRGPFLLASFALSSPGQLQRLMKSESGIKFNTISRCALS